MRRSWLIAGIAVVAVAILVAVVLARRSDSGSKTVGTTEWAGQVCTSFSDWRTSITSLANVSTGTLTRDALREKLTDAQVATEQLITDLKNIGPPETASGTELKQQLRQSGDELEQSYEDLKSGAQGTLDAQSVTGFLQGLAKLAPQFQKLLDQITSTIQTLESSNVAGSSADEVRQGFNDADSCKELRSEQD